MRSGSPNELIDKGISLDSLGKPSEALACYEQAEWLAGPVQGVLGTHFKMVLVQNRAVAYEHLKEFEKSIVLWDQSIGLAQQLPAYDREIGGGPHLVAEHLAGKALTLTEMGKYDKAARACQKALQLEPSNARAIATAGLVALRQGDCEQAVRWCTKALEIDPNDAHTLANLGAALGDLNRVEEAHAALRRALAIAPALPSALYVMGTLLAETGSSERAIPYLEGAVARDPSSNGWNNLGMAYMQSGRPGARKCFKRAVQADQRNEVAFKNLVCVIREEEKCTDVEAVALASVSAGFYGSLLEQAHDFYQLGHFSEALVLFERVLRDDPGNAYAEQGRSLCLSQIGRNRPSSATRIKRLFGRLCDARRE
ncbi:MAG: tetratricopeptide repeat protein [Ktedonobacterales bacterium]